MTLVGNVLTKLKELLRTMIGSRTIEQALNVTYVISPEMEKAIQLWTNLYKGKPDWVHEPTQDDPTRVVSLGIPAMIASEKARMALLEFESKITAPIEEVEIDNPDYKGPEKDDLGNLIPSAEPKVITETKIVGNPERADYLDKQYLKLKKQLRKQIEYGIAKGGLVIKPYVVVNKAETETGVDSDITPTIEIEFDFVQADSFYPLAFDASGKITEAAFIQTKTEKEYIYRRLEYHKWENNVVTVLNKAYKSKNLVGSTINDSQLGEEIPLTDVSEWKDLQEQTIIKNVTQPLFAYFKMPDANTIDTTSPLGVSGFSRAVSLIKDADLQYSRLLWEYEAGEMAIDIDRDALREVTLPNGQIQTVPNHLQNRLYRKLDLGSDSNTYYPFAPSLRDRNYIDGLNTILMRIEDVCGISRGALSDSAEVARTATELKILKQRSYQSNAEIQSAIEEALRTVVYIMNVYSTLYQITPEGDYEINFEWDDSIIVDVDEETNKRVILLDKGITSQVETRMWYFGETEQQAREALQKVRQERMDNLQNELLMESTYFNKDKNDDDNENNQNNQSRQNSQNNQPNKKQNTEQSE